VLGNQFFRNLLHASVSPVNFQILPLLAARLLAPSPGPIDFDLSAAQSALNFRIAFFEYFQRMAQGADRDAGSGCNLFLNIDPFRLRQF